MENKKGLTLVPHIQYPYKDMRFPNENQFFM
jgi:hypothetical protein